jgi:hypothetical protein
MVVVVVFFAIIASFGVAVANLAALSVVSVVQLVIFCIGIAIVVSIFCIANAI